MSSYLFPSTPPLSPQLRQRHTLPFLCAFLLSVQQVHACLCSPAVGGRGGAKSAGRKKAWYSSFSLFHTHPSSLGRGPLIAKSIIELGSALQMIDLLPSKPPCLLFAVIKKIKDDIVFLSMASFLYVYRLKELERKRDRGTDGETRWGRWGGGEGGEGSHRRYQPAHKYFSTCRN